MRDLELIRQSPGFRQNDVAARCSEPPFLTHGGQDDGSYTNSLKPLITYDILLMICWSLVLFVIHYLLRIIGWLVWLLGELVDANANVNANTDVNANGDANANANTDANSNVNAIPFQPTNRPTSKPNQYSNQAPKPTNREYIANK